ncbi:MULTISPECIES: hypothetical protein [Aerosakkonema]|uniref:hypothetical protein n=1 Tax=Aerosakkonema TaxID=1246629 RepID=UPI0035B7A14A
MKKDRDDSVKAEENLETHSLFPSGEWEGFYTHEFGPYARQHMMSFTLTFKKGSVRGSGIDDVNRFTWRGNYDKEKLRCWMNKGYPSHTVFYDGYVDQNGIWGTWVIPPYYQGGFHIWPKKLGENISVSDQEEVPKAVIKEVVTV